MSCMSRETEKVHIVGNSMLNELNVVDMQAVAIKNKDLVLYNSHNRS